MKKLMVLLVALSLTGCVTNGQFDGKKTALLIGGMVVVGAIAASSGSSSNPAQDPNCPIGYPDPNSIGTVVCR